MTIRFQKKIRNIMTVRIRMLAENRVKTITTWTMSCNLIKFLTPCDLYGFDFRPTMVIQVLTVLTCFGGLQTTLST